LADQLVLPFALAGGGAFTAVKPSQHTLTAIDIARRFGCPPLAIERYENGTNLVHVG
jgi:RNA 3'-terminal phosphate cyclase (ATP)